MKTRHFREAYLADDDHDSEGVHLRFFLDGKDDAAVLHIPWDHFIHLAHSMRRLGRERQKQLAALLDETVKLFGKAN